jgi:hypothetical protein
MSNRGKTIHLKTKKLKSGKISYYLQVYSPLNGKRNKEYLGLYIDSKPKSAFDRNHNQETKKIAESIFAKRLLEILNGNHGFRPKEIRQITLLTYFQKLTEEKKKFSETSFSGWKSSLKHLQRFSKDAMTHVFFNVFLHSV